MSLYDRLGDIHVLDRYFSIIINHVSQERSYQVYFEITLNIWQFSFLENQGFAAPIKYSDY